MSRKPIRKTWKTHLLSGLLLFGCAGYFLWYFTDLEHSHRTEPISWLLATLYNWGGKWLVFLVFAALGVVEIVASVRKLRLMQ